MVESSKEKISGQEYNEWDKCYELVRGSSCAAYKLHPDYDGLDVQLKQLQVIK